MWCDTCLKVGKHIVGTMKDSDGKERCYLHSEKYKKDQKENERLKRDIVIALHR